MEAVSRVHQRVTRLHIMYNLNPLKKKNNTRLGNENYHTIGPYIRHRKLPHGWARQVVEEHWCGGFRCGKSSNVIAQWKQYRVCTSASPGSMSCSTSTPTNVLIRRFWHSEMYYTNAQLLRVWSNRVGISSPGSVPESPRKIEWRATKITSRLDHTRTSRAFV